MSGTRSSSVEQNGVGAILGGAVGACDGEVVGDEVGAGVGEKVGASVVLSACCVVIGDQA